MYGHVEDVGVGEDVIVKLEIDSASGSVFVSF